jgi:hypothetical protein
MFARGDGDDSCSAGLDTTRPHRIRGDRGTGRMVAAPSGPGRSPHAGPGRPPGGALRGGRTARRVPRMVPFGKRSRSARHGVPACPLPATSRRGRTRPNCRRRPSGSAVGTEARCLGGSMTVRQAHGRCRHMASASGQQETWRVGRPFPGRHASRSYFGRSQVSLPLYCRHDNHPGQSRHPAPGPRAARSGRGLIHQWNCSLI